MQSPAQHLHNVEYVKVQLVESELRRDFMANNSGVSFHSPTRTTKVPGLLFANAVRFYAL